MLLMACKSRRPLTAVDCNFRFSPDFQDGGEKNRLIFLMLYMDSKDETLMYNKKYLLLKNHQNLIICLFIAVFIFSIYGRVIHYNFISLDDNEYVYENYYVQKGLTSESIKWAFTNTEAGIWIPGTWLSLMTDYELSGLNPGRFHLTNVLIHTANALLLFLLLNGMTRALWKSAFIAGLFAVHPLQVESVAWITERKDVLSIFFMFSAMAAYLKYVKKPGILRYFFVLLIYTAGLMTKPMLVTFPFILLLLDYWPLNRLRTTKEIPAGLFTGKFFHAPAVGKINLNILVEKIPFLILSSAVSLITLIIGKDSTLKNPDLLTVYSRISNAVLSYAGYIFKILLPRNLAISPDMGETLPFWKTGMVLGALLCVTVLVILLRKRYPFFFFGWFWYITALLPVTGIFQTGSQLISDRFTYMPVIGIFFMLTYGGEIILKKLRRPFIPAVFAAAAALLSLSAVSWVQAGYWRDTLTFFGHAAKVTSSNWIAYNSIGIEYENRGDLSGAVENFSKAAGFNPKYYYANYNLARVYAKLGNFKKAAELYASVVKLKPDFAEAVYNLALTYAKMGKPDEAVKYYKQALNITQDFFEAHYNVALLLQNQGKFDEAAAHFTETLRVNDNNYLAHYYLAQIYTKQKNFPAALKHYSSACSLNPGFAEAHYYSGNIYAETGNFQQAIKHYKEAIRIKPDFAEAYNSLGNILEYRGKPVDAAILYLKALSIKPNSAVFHRNLGDVLLKIGKNGEAAVHFREAERLEKENAK